jgi:hypothetical protein
MSYQKFNIVTELKKASQGHKSKVDSSVLLSVIKDVLKQKR